MILRVAGVATAGVLVAGTALAEAYVYDYMGYGAADEDIRIIISDKGVVINPGTEDQMVTNFESNDIYVLGPDGKPMSMRQMVAQFAPSGGASGGASSGGGGDEELEALKKGLPAQLLPMIEQQLGSLSRQQQILALKTLRGELGLGDVGASVGAMPKPEKELVVDTGRTENRGGHELREKMVAGDTIWVTDADNVDYGEEFIDGMVKVSVVFNDIAEGLPVPDSSFFRMGELGGFPYQVITGDGEEYRYEGTSMMSLGEVEPYFVMN